MSRLALWSATLIAVVIAATPPATAQNAGQDGARRKVVAAAPGRIEGSADPVPVGASITGIVEKVAVRQGDPVSAGDVLVRIACHTVEAQLAARTAEHEAAEALHRKLVNGARPEDIDIAQADLRLAEARLSEAQVRAAATRTSRSSMSRVA